MSKELKNIKDSVMNQIHGGEVKMKPKIYFIIGSILTFIGLISTVIFSTFLVGLIKFSLRTHGPMGQYRFDEIISNFPWWTTILAIFGLIIGIWLIRRYDFSYKKNPLIIIFVFIITIIIGGLIIDTFGLNERLIQRGPMKTMMGNYNKGNNIQNNQGLKFKIYQNNF